MELFLLVCILVYKTNWKQVGRASYYYSTKNANRKR